MYHKRERPYSNHVPVLDVVPVNMHHKQLVHMIDNDDAYGHKLHHPFDDDFDLFD